LRIPRLPLAVLGCLAAQGALAGVDTAICQELGEGGGDPGRVEARHERACYAWGMALVRRASAYDSRLAVAERMFRRLQLMRPRSAYAYAGLAEAGMRRRDLGLPDEPSVETIREAAARAAALRRAPAEAYVTLGRAELLAGCVSCAAREAEVARALRAAMPELDALRAQVAEARGNVRDAREILERAAAAPPLAAEDRSWLLAALGELLARHERYEEAVRAFSGAIDAWSENLPAYLRRAEIRMFDLGDIDGALSPSDWSRRASATTRYKILRDMARYLRWSRDKISGRPGEDLQRIVQTAYLAPSDALVACARHPALASEFKVMLEAGLARKVDAVDGAGDTALLAAAAGGNTAAIRLLLPRGADVNAADRRHRRPVTFSVERSDGEILALLLEAGADIDYKDVDGRSPLLISVRRGDSASAIRLLGHQGKQSMGPLADAGDLLAAAASSGDVAMVKALLDAGVQADAPDARGQTALISAVRWGNAGAAKLLLERGADASKALEAARDAEDGAMVELLRPFLKRAI
jgi:hypothetical protein